MIDKRPISEAWGDKASIEPCFENTISYGSEFGATKISDISNLVDTSKITFNHYVTSIRVCTLPV